MNTTSIREKEVTRDWYLIDAEGEILGRLASKVAQLIRGKNKPYFTPHMDMGDFVVVINAEKVKVTGKKEEDKSYFRHSGYPGGVTHTSLKKMRQDFPERVITNAVKGMLPHNRLGRKLLTHLKVFPGAEHTHSAQLPKTIKI